MTSFLIALGIVALVLIVIAALRYDGPDEDVVIEERTTITEEIIEERREKK